MNKNYFIIAGIAVIVLFTLLGGTLKFYGCDALFSDACQIIDKARNIIGLIAASLVLFVISLVFAIIHLLKKYNWAQYVEIASLAVGAILMITAVCITSDYFGSVHGPTMVTIAMTLSVELTVILIVLVFVQKKL